MYWSFLAENEVGFVLFKIARSKTVGGMRGIALFEFQLVGIASTQVRPFSSNPTGC